MKEKLAGNRERRSFGLIVGSGLAVIAFWPLVRDEAPRASLLVVSLLLGIAAVAAPATLTHPYRIWMAIGHTLGWINTRIILGAIFFGVVTPMGLIRRVLRKDSMGRRPRPDLDSYRQPRSARPASHMTRQY